VAQAVDPAAEISEHDADRAAREQRQEHGRDAHRDRVGAARQTRENMSRPCRSPPNQFSALGAESRIATSVSFQS